MYQKYVFYDYYATRPNLTYHTKLTKPNLPCQTNHAKSTILKSPWQIYHTKLTMPNLPYQTYHTKLTMPNFPSPSFSMSLKLFLLICCRSPSMWGSSHLVPPTKITMTNLSYQTYYAKPTMLNLPCQTYHTKPTIPNSPCRTYHTKLTMPNQPYETYHTKPTIPNVPCQTYHAKPTIPNLPCQTSLRRASRWASSSSCWSAVGRRPCGAPPTWSRPATGSSPARCSGGTATRPGAYYTCRPYWWLRVAFSAGHCEQRGYEKALFYECSFVWVLVNFFGNLKTVVFSRMLRLISYGLFFCA